MRGKRISAAAGGQLLGYDWSRDSLRGRRKVSERRTRGADGDVLRAEHVPQEIRDQSRGDVPPGGASERGFAALKAEAERQIVVAALERHDWHITRTAQDLGLADHASLLKIMRRLDLRRD